VPDIRIPKLGLDTLECDISKWLVSVGDRVEIGAPLLEVETEKAVVAIEAEASGTIERIDAKAGSSVPVGAIVGSIREAGE
jgi:pyruvate/2-oxoglutarate dehydrogenase complex dihydrolipoamide acyltransferase (E2) component